MNERKNSPLNSSIELSGTSGLKDGSDGRKKVSFDDFITTAALNMNIFWTQKKNIKTLGFSQPYN